MTKLKDKHFQVPLDHACVVMEKKFWDHMIEVYTIMASDCSDPAEKRDWEAILAHVKFWVETTYNDPLSADDYE